jgi:hypothetical protein
MQSYMSFYVRWINLFDDIHEMVDREGWPQKAYLPLPRVFLL